MQQRKKQTTDMYESMDEPQKHYAKGKNEKRPHIIILVILNVQERQIHRSRVRLVVAWGWE